MNEADRQYRIRTRLARVARLHSIGSPAWVIKHEKCCLAALRRGKSPGSQYFADLYEKHVVPLS